MQAQQVSVWCTLLCSLDRFIPEILQGKLFLFDELYRLNACRNHSPASWKREHDTVWWASKWRDNILKPSLRFSDTLNSLYNYMSKSVCFSFVCLWWHNVRPKSFPYKVLYLSLPYTDMTCISQTFSPHHKTLPVTWLLKCEMTAALFLTPQFDWRQEVTPAWKMISIPIVLKCYLKCVKLR